MPETESGVIFGFKADSFVPVIFDPFALSNFNGIILGSSGSGKSMASKSFIMKNIFNGTKVTIIDPQGEYSKLALAIGGKVLDEKTGVGIFPSPGMNPEERMDIGLEFFQIACNITSFSERSVLAKAIKACFLKHGIKKEKPETWQNEGPNATEIVEELNKFPKSQK